MHTEGNVAYEAIDNKQYPKSSINLPTAQHQLLTDKAYQHISIAAPYLDVIEELTTTEFLQFHQSFKPLTQPIPQILSAVGLHSAANKQIRYFSSGMKQRLKLAQAFFSNTTVLLLDEPTTNLDADGIEIYNNLWQLYTLNKLVIVSSNDAAEYKNCKEVIKIGDFKLDQL